MDNNNNNDTTKCWSDTVDGETMKQAENIG